MNLIKLREMNSASDISGTDDGLFRKPNIKRLSTTLRKRLEMLKAKETTFHTNVDMNSICSMMGDLDYEKKDIRKAVKLLVASGHIEATDFQCGKKYRHAN